MKTKSIEVTNGPQNWGKFLIGRFDSEWEWKSAIAKYDSGEPMHLLSTIGQCQYGLLVLDLQTCEGAIFRPGGSVKYDLDKHKIWVCPMYEPFLEWLYKQDVHDLDKLPAHVDLPDAPFDVSGYRRKGIATCEK